MRLVLLALFSIVCALVACKDPAREAAEAKARDREALKAVVLADSELDRTLKRVDDLSAKGDDTAAALFLEKDAAGQADRAFATATAASVTTEWGKARRDEWLAILRDRRAEIPRYLAALRSNDLEAKLAAVEAQAALQRRALAAALAVD
jgi:hypothetical protein